MIPNYSPTEASQWPIQHRARPAANPVRRNPDEEQPHEEQRDEAAQVVKHRVGEGVSALGLFFLDGTLLADHVAFDLGLGVYLCLRTGLVGEVPPNQGRIGQGQPWLYRSLCRSI
jgi:hypothetical protein